MIQPLSKLPDHLELSDWPEIEGRLQSLLDRELAPEHVPDWLAAWSELATRIGESAALVSIEHSRDTADAERKAAYMHLIREVMPRLREAEQALKQRLLGTGYEDEPLATTLRQFRAEAELFRPENLELLAEEQATASRYDELTGSLTVDFEGEERTLSQLRPFMAAPDRATRQAAWETGQAAFQSLREPLDEVYGQLLPLRERIAENADFASYRDYKWRALGRFDYSPEDALRFHAAIRETFVPALERRAERRAALLGLDRLRPWDVDVDPHGSGRLTPFRTGDELAETSARVFDKVGPVFGERLRAMQQAGLLDLENRKGKAPGGYCATLAARGLPFIFMNAVGTDDNLRTMLHECGHAFHVFETRPLPYVWQQRAPMEFAEVASMAMELLASPFVGQDSGGFYDERQAFRSRVQHLERMLFFMPYMATVSAFQHWVYSHPGHGTEDRHAAWLELHESFAVGCDWSGLEAERESLWHQKLHIFRLPFYYIEYGIAQLGALQIWRNSLTDPEAALERYRSALSLGGTRRLPDLFAAAGAELIFDGQAMADLVDLIETEIQALEAQLHPA